jgi:hypothetical protein
MCLTVLQMLYTPNAGNECLSMHAPDRRLSEKADKRRQSMLTAATAGGPRSMVGPAAPPGGSGGRAGASHPAHKYAPVIDSVLVRARNQGCLPTVS